MSTNTLFISDRLINGCVIFTPDDLKNKAEQIAKYNATLMPYTTGPVNLSDPQHLKNALQREFVNKFLSTSTVNPYIEELFENEFRLARLHINELIRFINDFTDKTDKVKANETPLVVEAHEWYPYQEKLTFLGIIEAMPISYRRDSHYDGMRISIISELLKFSNIRFDTLLGDPSEEFVPYQREDGVRSRMIWDIRKMSFIAEIHRKIHNY